MLALEEGPAVDGFARLGVTRQAVEDELRRLLAGLMGNA
ncbi:hypothetical protein [Nonomuraea africana]